MNNKPLKIAFLSSYSPDDRKASSGTNFKMAERLAEIGDVTWIPIKQTSVGRYLFGITRKWNRHCKTKINLAGTIIGSKLCYRNISKETLEEFDIIAAFFCMPVLAEIKTTKPILYFSDATFPAMINYYGDFTNMLKSNIKKGIELERKAMDNASRIILASKWAADSTQNHLSQPLEKVKVVELGANIDSSDILESDTYDGGELRILFSGVDWIRKGGEIAIEATRTLRNEYHIDAKLFIVGIRELPDEYANIPYVENIGFLNKNNLEEYNKYIETIKKTHILLLPTKAECAGVVFCEASAYGIPSFTYDTGGIPNYVINTVNGYRLPMGSSGKTFAECIYNSITKNELPLLHKGARQLYTEKLNWNTWGQSIKAIIDDILTKN